jgi:NAD-dependent DNA ligase
MTEKYEVGGAALRRVHEGTNRRKLELYWLGFLQGAMASGRIEHAELNAIRAEAQAFADFFNDPDAKDLLEDIAHVHGVFDNDLFEQLDDIVSVRRKLAINDSELTDKDRMNEFLGFCAGIIADGEVLEAEARAIVGRFQLDQHLRNHPHLTALSDTLGRALADHELTNAESEDVKSWIQRIVGDGYADTGVASIGGTSQLQDMIQHHSHVEFPGRLFVVTGALRIAPRRTIARMLEELDASLVNHISWKTNYLVVSPAASRDWRSTHFGTKIEAAQKIIADGGPLRLVSEHVFEEALNTRLSR